MPATIQPSPRANCFVIGAPRAGTTAIDRLLRGHPDVFLTPAREPGHFCPDVAAQLATSFRQKRQLDVATYLESPREVTGLAWVGAPEAYARLLEKVDGQRVVGECSGFYLSSGAAPELIGIYNPAARIVATLRRPLDRIRSHYETDRRRGIVKRPLLDLVEEELALGTRAHWGNCAYYIGASRYREQLYAWHEHFPAESICVLSFERMRADPRNELGRLFAFLGIPEPEDMILPASAGDQTAPAGTRRRAGLKPRLLDILRRLLPERPGRGPAASSTAVSARELQRLQYVLREEGLEEDWTPDGELKTATQPRTAPASQTQARS